MSVKMDVQMTPRAMYDFLLYHTYSHLSGLIGAIFGVVGLGLGILLHRYIMLTVELDNMMFGRQIAPLSFIYSAGLTILFAFVVNFAMYYKLKKIEMVESLKSVD